MIKGCEILKEKKPRNEVINNGKLLTLQLRKQMGYWFLFVFCESIQKTDKKN